jgi:hypothetical protein
MKNLHLKFAALTIAVVVTAGCLKSDVTETWYVDGAGTVTWVTQEQNVRSDAQSPLDRPFKTFSYSASIESSRAPTLKL